MKCSSSFKVNRFTLVEVMVAIFVVSVSSLGIYSCLMFARTNALNSRLRLEAQRFSYDEAHRILRKSREEINTEFDGFTWENSAPPVSIEKGIESLYNDYEVSKKSKTQDNYLDLTTDLRDYNCLVQYVLRQLLNKEGNIVGCRADVTVKWTPPQVMWTSPQGKGRFYTTTVYRYDD